MKLEGKIIDFLGDSITEGVGVSEADNIYLNRMKRMCALRAANNYGVSGTRIARQHTPSQNADFDRDFCMRCTELNPDADVIVVMGGTNDFGHGDAPLGTPADRTPATFYGACHYMMRSLAETYVNSLTVICTPMHRLNEDSLTGDCKPAPVAALRTYVRIMRETAEYYSLPVIDLFATSGIQPRVEAMRQRYMPDGLHPNDAGHEVMARRIAGFLRAL